MNVEYEQVQRCLPLLRVPRDAARLLRVDAFAV